MLTRGAEVFRLAALALTLPSFSALAAPAPVVDESPKHPAFSAFRNSFLKALRRRDLDYLEASALNKADITALRKLPPSAQASKLKPVDKAIRLGCISPNPKEQGFKCPSTKFRWPLDKDPKAHVATTQHGVNLRQGPKAQAVKLAALPMGVYPLCQLLRLGQDTHIYKGFVCLKAGPTKQGFVREEFVSSPFEPVVTFVRKNNRWYWTGDIP